MFGKIPHANDGSDPAFRALALALEIAKQNPAPLHMVCVEEIDYMPEYIEEVLRGDRDGRAPLSRRPAARARPRGTKA